MKRRAPQHDRTARPSRRRRILRVALAVFAVLLVGRFFGLRATDRTAWPAPAPGVRLAPLPAAGAGFAVRAACREIEAALPPAADAPVRALHALQALGFAALPPDDRTAVESWFGAGSPPDAQPWDDYVDLVVNGFGFASDPDGAAVYAGFVGRSAEAALSVAGSMEARFAENGFVSSKPVRVVEYFVRFFFRGAGLLGRTAALGGATAICRSVSMGSVEWPAFDEAAGRNAVDLLRSAESNIANCAEALREDLVSIRAAVHAIYTGEGGGHLAAAAGGAAPKGLRGFGGWVVRRLGGTEEATLAHLDALFSRLVANAENPYSPDGLVAGLPDWCRLKGRTPWTRDPVGAAIAGAYLRHAVVAAAVEPTLRLELRAARIAVALRLWKDAHGAYPETLGELAAGERPLLGPADFADPFSPDGAPLRYGRDGDGWRFWSVGLDGIDGGGARDAFTAPPGADASDADLVFTSRERDIRRAALAPAP